MKKVVIIGAGPAGLTTAYELLKKEKYEVIILEKDSGIGGISKTVSIDDQYLVDTGIHRFFSKNDKINEIWREILQIQSKPAFDDIKLKRVKKFEEKGSDPEKEDNALLIRDRYTRIYYGKKFYDYPISLEFKNIRKLGFFTVCKAGMSYVKAKIFRKEENSLENFYINRFGKVLYSIFFENYTQKVWGIHPSKISADWGVQRVKGVSVSEIIKHAIRKILHINEKNKVETSLIESFVYPKFGAGQMWNEMAKKIQAMGGKIITEAKVTRTYIENKQIKSVNYIRGTQEVNENIKDIDILVSSMPIRDLIKSINIEKVPQKIYNYSINLPYRDFMSVCMVVKKLKLENRTKIKTIGNIVPDNWIYIQEPNVKLGRIQIFNNWSPYLFKEKNDLENKVLIGLEYFCSQNDEYWNMKDEDFIQFAKDEVVKIGIIDKDDLITAKRIKIADAYPAYFGTYERMEDIIKYLDTFTNLYCIGRNGQHRYNNMDHSMLTGIETANNIINQKGGKENIWNVNTEKVYHEVK